jgi:hypothetical protein
VSVVVQKGTGARRPLVVGYYIAPDIAALYTAALGPAVCFVSDVDDTGGRFAKVPGAGGVETIAQVVEKAKAADPSATFEVSAVVLVGWSAGCQAVREQLRADAAAVDGALVLDGISGAVPPTAAQMAPWLDLAKLASEAGPLLVVSHTQQTYTETLPVVQRFASTVTTARVLCDSLGLAAPAPGAEVASGDFHVISSPSKSIDGTAHIAQVRVVGPDAAKRLVAPWLAAREVAQPEPAPLPPPVLGA